MTDDGQAAAEPGPNSGLADRAGEPQPGSAPPADHGSPDAPALEADGSGLRPADQVPPTTPAPPVTIPASGTRRAILWSAAEARGVPLRAILATIIAVIAFYLAGRVVYRLKDVLLLIAVAGFIALLLNPLVVAVQAKLGRRGLAVTVVTLLAVLVFAGLALAFGYPLVNGISHLAADLPRQVSKAEHGKGWVGHLVVKYHVQHWVKSNAPKLASYGKNLAAPVLSVGAGALSLMVSLLTIFVLVVLLLMEGPKIRAWLLGIMVPARARRYSRIASEVNRSVVGFMLGNFATSVTAGLVVLVDLIILGVPFPFLWALWVALVDFLPMIGGALAGIPVVLFTLTQSLTAAVVTLVVFLLYTQIENHILNPIIMSRTVRINPLLVLIAILVGASLGSWVGGIFGGFVVALLSIPLAGALQVVVREVWRSTDPAVIDPAVIDPAFATEAAPESGAPAAGAGATTTMAAATAAAGAAQRRPARWAVPRRQYVDRRLRGRRRPESTQKPPG